MSRYIIHKKALEFLSVVSLLATEELSRAKVITDEALHFNNLDVVSVMLTVKQVAELQSRGFIAKPEARVPNICLGPNYQKVNSNFFKAAATLNDGEGCKVAILDSGCNIAFVPVDYAENFVDENEGIEDVFGHGTPVTSIVKSSTIGLANGCEVHHLKVVNDAGEGNESAILAALDYCIDNNIDIINCSWTFDTTALRDAIAALIGVDCMVVASCGNDTGSPYTTLFPAALPGVIAVNSIKDDGSLHYMNINAPEGGHGVTLTASGYACETIRSDGEGWLGYGTSFASPWVAGAFAIYKKRYAGASNAEIMQMLIEKSLKTNTGAYVPTF